MITPNEARDHITRIRSKLDDTMRAVSVPDVDWEEATKIVASVRRDVYGLQFVFAENCYKDNGDVGLQATAACTMWLYDHNMISKERRNDEIRKIIEQASYEGALNGQRRESEGK